MGGNAGTGIVMRKLGHNKWSAPSSLRYVGAEALFVLGIEITDYVIIMNTQKAVNQFLQPKFSFDLRASISVVAGKSGELLAAPVRVYAYSRGLYVGLSAEVGLFYQSQKVNQKFYGEDVSVPALLNGKYAPPKAAEPLYRILQAAEVASMNASGSASESIYEAIE